jgi:hypothetical protein
MTYLVLLPVYGSRGEEALTWINQDADVRGTFGGLDE